MAVSKGSKYPFFVLGIFTLFWMVVAIAPRYREIWIAENILAVLLILALIFTYRKFRFSNFSYTLIFFFLILQTIGSHYSYSEVPWFDLLTEEFGLSRNHYDRVVHFLFGVLFYIPVRELLVRKAHLKGWWSYAFPFICLVALKATYEVLEWGWYLVRESKITDTNFLGMQGDQWDAQKDILVGMVGSTVSWIAVWWKEKKNNQNL